MADDLVKRLREVTGGKLQYTNTPNHLRLEAADRIEELEAERDEAWKRAAHAEKMWGEAEVKLATCKKYRDAYAECDRIATQAVRDLEAKLAKAMELANLVVEFSDRALWKVAKNTVLELKGEK